MARAYTSTAKRCRWCGAPLTRSTAWEQRYPLPVCLLCRFGDGPARRNAGPDALPAPQTRKAA